MSEYRLLRGLHFEEENAWRSVGGFVYFGVGRCFEMCFSFEEYVEFELDDFGWKLCFG